MDPSKLQSDSDNDVHSLEGTDTVVEDGKNANTSATDSSSEGNIHDATHGNAPQQSAKPPLFKRIWQKFNIYLLLFILIVVIAIGVSVIFYVKNRATNVSNKDVINSQNLSAQALKQLSNTSVNVGNSNQVLNIDSNAVFGSSVLIRSDLEVAGDIKIGGALQLPGITISGSSRLSQLSANDVSIAGTATVQGVFVAKKGLNVTGNSTIAGTLTASQIATSSLQLNGDLILTHHITAGGPIPGVGRGTALGSGGTTSVSGSDTSGSITINTGSSPAAGCFTTISFTTAFNNTPHVVVTPIGSDAAGLQYYVNRGTTSFSICTASPAPSGVTFGFDYIVLD
jgi:cytoskeletal protein CcmA (bactofilin family)